MLEQPLATAEFLALDTETNGLAGDRCELTEVGAVLVGGGELHDEFESLVGVAHPLGRGIQRFTGITQAMVDAAPAPEDVLPAAARRCCAGGCSWRTTRAFDVRVLRQAFARAALEWPAPPVMCTVALARRFAPLQRRRGLATLAAALGIEVDAVHRALPDARTCARVFCALFGRLCANAPTIGDAIALLGARKVRSRPPKVKRPRGERPHLAGLPHEPGVYIFRDADGRPLYVGKSVDLRTRARSHFTTGATWAAEAEHVDHQVTESELGALLLEDRLIKALRPPGQRARQGRARRLRLPALPAGHPVPDPRGRARARRGPRGLRRPGARPRRRGRAGRAAQLAVRAAPLRAHAAAPRAPLGLRADGPLPLALPERPGPEPLPRAAGRRRCSCSSAATAARRCSSASTEQIARGLGGARYERAAWLQRRRVRLEALLERLGGVLRATHTGARLVLAPHPEARGALRRDLDRGRPRRGLGPAHGGDAGGGRCAPRSAADAARSHATRARSARAFARPARKLGGWLPADAVAEARLVGAWIAANQPPALELGARTGEAAHAAFLARAGFHYGVSGRQRERQRLRVGARAQRLAVGDRLPEVDRRDVGEHRGRCRSAGSSGWRCRRPVRTRRPWRGPAAAASGRPCR